ncbi:DEAD-box ATP-dependent RNA helicase 10, partial [Mucuna pruriens]
MNKPEENVNVAASSNRRAVNHRIEARLAMLYGTECGNLSVNGLGMCGENQLMPLLGEDIKWRATLLLEIEGKTIGKTIKKDLLVDCFSIDMIRKILFFDPFSCLANSQFHLMGNDLTKLRMGEENEEIKTFKDLGLAESLVEACEKLGWKNPLKIQTEAIPLALEG